MNASGVRPIIDGAALKIISGAWDLASLTALPDGALGVHYQRR
jgi:hypothetical protein